MLTEGDLANSIDQSDKVRELQDKIARLRAQVSEYAYRECSRYPPITNLTLLQARVILAHVD